MSKNMSSVVVVIGATLLQWFPKYMTLITCEKIDFDIDGFESIPTIVRILDLCKKFVPDRWVSRKSLPTSLKGFSLMCLR